MGKALLGVQKQLGSKIFLVRFWAPEEKYPATLRSALGIEVVPEDMGNSIPGPIWKHGIPRLNILLESEGNHTQSRLIISPLKLPSFTNVIGLTSSGKLIADAWIGNSYYSLR